LPFENDLLELKEFRFDEPKDRDPPKDREPNDLPPLPPKLPRASDVNGMMTKESIAVMKRIYACFMNAFMEYLRK
jgi:hypothetical protein